MIAETTGLNLAAIRAEFPALNQHINGHPLAYLDNAATTQKPCAVIQAIVDYYSAHNSNVHRGVHQLSQRATDQFEDARSKVATLIGADSVIFTKGSTEAINLVAHSWGLENLREGDRILLTQMEHHANIVPWQRVAAQTGAEIVPIPLNPLGEVDLDAYQNLLDERVKLVGVVHVSNSLGTVNPVQEMARLAHEVGAKVMVDGAQAPVHMAVDVKTLDADFYSLAGHKMYGPTGIGALYVKHEILQTMPPYQLGGGMIRTVTFEKSTYQGAPEKFEPGTPNIEGAIALGAAVDYLLSKAPGTDRTILEASAPHEKTLTEATHQLLSEIEGVTIHGNSPTKAGIVSFTMANAHPHDIGTILDANGVAIRAGHHCCQPLMTALRVPATARVSFAIYNTLDEVEQLVRAVKQVKEIFG